MMNVVDMVYKSIPSKQVWITYKDAYAHSVVINGLHIFSYQYKLSNSSPRLK